MVKPAPRIGWASRLHNAWRRLSSRHPATPPDTAARSVGRFSPTEPTEGPEKHGRSAPDERRHRGRCGASVLLCVGGGACQAVSEVEVPEGHARRFEDNRARDARPDALGWSRMGAPKPHRNRQVALRRAQPLGNHVSPHDPSPERRVADQETALRIMAQDLGDTPLFDKEWPRPLDRGPYTKTERSMIRLSARAASRSCNS